MRWRASLGQQPTTLPATTLRVVPVVSALLGTVRTTLRDEPWALFQRTLWQDRASADERYPYDTALPGPNGHDTGISTIHDRLALIVCTQPQTELDCILLAMTWTFYNRLFSPRPRFQNIFCYLSSLYSLATFACT